MVRPCDQNVQGKVSEASPAGYTHGKKAQRSTRDEVVGWFRLGVEPSAELSKTAENREIFLFLLGLLPRDSRQGKSGYEH